MRPLPPVIVIDLLDEERAALLALLDALTPEQWTAPTVCAGWSVKDIAAHVVADDLGAGSRADGWREGYFDAPSWDELLAFINRQNEDWVRAMRRLSPRIVCGLLRYSGERAFAYYRSLDPHATGNPVDWAGPGGAPVWLDIAREYTERWLHQQQIRDAVGAQPLDERRLFAPVLATFVRALPHAYRDVTAPDGTHVQFVATGGAGGEWSLVRQAGRWALYDGVDAPAAVTVTLDQDAAWRMFTRGIAPEDARRRATIDGDATLAGPLFQAVAIIA